MPDDPRTDPLLDVIFDYEHLPTVSPRKYPVIRGSGDSAREQNQPDKSFQRPINLRVNIPGKVIGRIISSPNDLFITWLYPELSPSIYGDLGIELGINPLTPASVAFEARILNGRFHEDDINNLSVYGVSSSGQQQYSQQRFPGPVVFETFVNLAPPSDPIWLSKPASGRVDVTNGILEEGNEYTAIVRHLFWTQAFDPLETSFEHYLSQYSIITFKVNSIPVATNLRVNGLKNPTIKSDDEIEVSFMVSENDGPELSYMIEVGRRLEPSNEFDPSGMFNSGEISTNLSNIENVEIKYKLSRREDFAWGIDYYWRVVLGDGFAYGDPTDATDMFRINSLIFARSLKINDNELIFGDVPTIDNEAATLSWELSDPDDEAQRAYSLILSSDGEEFLNTGIVRSNLSSVVLPDLPLDKRIDVSIRFKDGLEFGPDAMGSFVTNARPNIIDLLVDGKSNPGDVASFTPTISWAFEDNNPLDTQQYFQIQVARDDVFSDLVWDTGQVSGATSSVIYGSTPSPIIDAEVLLHGVLYHVRVKLSDGVSWSEYAIAFFSVNTAPGNPTLTVPAAGAYSGLLDITWLPADPLDGDGDDVTYVIEITSERSFDRGWSLLVGPLDGSETSYSLDLSSIPAGNNYGIRIIASDGFAESDPSSGGTSPRFTILNHPPETPVIIVPAEDDQVSTVMKVEWVEADPVDIDGDSVIYEADITSNYSSESADWTPLFTAVEGKSKLFIDVSEFADGLDYAIRIRAIDDKGEAGNYSVVGPFTISNSISIADFEKVSGILYLGSTDGRIFRANETIWQIDEDWSNQQRGKVPFEIFTRGTPQVNESGGKLEIAPSPGSTYLLRHSDQ
jgi:hypothetical protein